MCCRSWQWHTHCPWPERTSSWQLIGCQLSQAFLSRQPVVPLDGSANLAPTSVWQAMPDRSPDQEPRTHAYTLAYSRLKRSLLAAISCAYLPPGRVNNEDASSRAEEKHQDSVQTGLIASRPGRDPSHLAMLMRCCIDHTSEGQAATLRLQTAQSGILF